MTGANRTTKYNVSLGKRTRYFNKKDLPTIDQKSRSVEATGKLVDQHHEKEEAKYWSDKAAESRAANRRGKIMDKRADLKRGSVRATGNLRATHRNKQVFDAEADTRAANRKWKIMDKRKATNRKIGKGVGAAAGIGALAYGAKKLRDKRKAKKLAKTENK